MSARVSPRTRAALGWLLAPILGVLAIGIQDLADVPEGEMLGHEPPQLVGDAGKPKRPAKDKSKAKDDDARKAKPRKRGSSYVPREDAERRALRGRWAEREIESEPVDKSFQRHHDALLRAIVTRLRSDLLAGQPPTPMQIRPKCHSIRCELELCSERALLDPLAERLAAVSLDGSSLWHELTEVEAKRQPPKRDAKQHQKCRRWIIDFASEGAMIGELELAAPVERDETGETG